MKKFFIICILFAACTKNKNNGGAQTNTTIDPITGISVNLNGVSAVHGCVTCTTEWDAIDSKGVRYNNVYASIDTSFCNVSDSGLTEFLIYHNNVSYQVETMYVVTKCKNK
jgi:hypothetical protein